MKTQTKLLIFVMLIAIIVSWLVFFALKVQADDLGGLTKEDYYVYTIPETRLYIIKSADKWRALMKYHYGEACTGAEIGTAIAETRVKNGRLVTDYYILMPHATYPLLLGGFEEWLNTVGHETLHIINYYKGYKVFNIR